MWSSSMKTSPRSIFGLEPLQARSFEPSDRVNGSSSISKPTKISVTPRLFASDRKATEPPDGSAGSVESGFQ